MSVTTRSKTSSVVPEPLRYKAGVAVPLKSSSSEGVPPPSFTVTASLKVTVTATVSAGP